MNEFREWAEGSGRRGQACWTVHNVFLCFVYIIHHLKTTWKGLQTSLKHYLWIASLGLTNDFHHTVTVSSCMHFVTHVTPENCGARIACNFKDTNTYLPQVMSPWIPRGRWGGARKQPWLSHHTCLGVPLLKVLFWNPCIHFHISGWIPALLYYTNVSTPWQNHFIIS